MGYLGENSLTAFWCIQKAYSKGDEVPSHNVCKGSCPDFCLSKENTSTEMLVFLQLQGSTYHNRPVKMGLSGTIQVIRYDLRVLSYSASPFFKGNPSTGTAALREIPALLHCEKDRLREGSEAKKRHDRCLPDLVFAPTLAFTGIFPRTYF